MAAGLTLVVAFGVMSLIALYIAFNVDKQHKLWTVITIMVVLTSFYVIPKAVYDDYQGCQLVVVNETVTGNLTQKDYDRVCAGSEFSTPSMLQRGVSIFLYMFFAYIPIYIVYVLSNGFLNIADYFRRKFGRGGNK